jgi:hypothetical protein
MLICFWQIASLSGRDPERGGLYKTKALLLYCNAFLFDMEITSKLVLLNHFVFGRLRPYRAAILKERDFTKPKPTGIAGSFFINHSSLQINLRSGQ